MISPPRLMISPNPFVLSLSKDASVALGWFDKLTTSGIGFLGTFADAI